MSDHQEADWQRWVREQIQENTRRIDVHVHIAGLAEIGSLILTGFNEIKQEIRMSGSTLSAQVDAGNAATAVALDSIQTDVTAIAAELAAGVPTAGSTISQAQVDTMNANIARLQAVKTALDGLVVPATVTHTPEDTTDLTPNGSARADGSIRNNFFMPNFNPANPETT